MPELTLGLLGDGPVSEELNRALLADQVKAARDGVTFLFPMTERSPFSPLDVAAQFVQDNEAVSYQQVESVVAALELADNPRLLVYWRETDEELKAAIRRAIEAQIEVRDLCDVLAGLGKAPEPPKENRNVPKAAKEEEPTVYTQDELESMDEDECAAVAESLGIDHTEYADWDEVVAKILEVQSGEEPAEEAEEAEEEEAEDEVEGEDENPTEEELMAMDLDDLKDLVKENGIEVPGERPRKATYVKAILEYIAAGNGEEEEEVAEEVEAAAEALDAEVLVAEITESVLTALDERLTQLAADVDTMLDKHVKAVTEALADLLEKQGSVESSPAPVKETAKPTVAKKPGVRKLTRK